jgi:hypothetical protein
MSITLKFRPRPLDYSDSAFRHFRERYENDTHRSFAKSICESIVQAASFDKTPLHNLSHRDIYPFAVAFLSDYAGCGEPLVDALTTPPAPSIEPFRLARLLGVPIDNYLTPVSTSYLRELNSEDAQCALAALGEIDWPSASTRARTIFLLRTLIAEVRS